jgi:hypothetical protein
MIGGQASGAALPATLKRQLRRLCTGDVLLFSSEGLAAGLVKLVSGSEWSHVGIVVRHEGRIYLGEATPDSDIRCDHCQRSHGGVRYVLLEDRLRLPGKVACRRLLGVPPAKREEMTRLAWTTFHGMPYSSYFKAELYLCVADLNSRLFLNKAETGEHNKEFFCSELVVRLYEGAALLKTDENYRANEFTPGSLAAGKNKLPLIERDAARRLYAKLGRQVMLKA